MARAFKVRSAERDAQTDSERLGSISAAVEAAVASIRGRGTPCVRGSMRRAIRLPLPQALIMMNI